MFDQFSADIQNMQIPFFEILIGVFKSPYVIGTAIFVIIYISFGSYVARYTKKPPKPVKKKVAPPPPPPEPSGDESGETGEE